MLSAQQAREEGTASCHTSSQRRYQSRLTGQPLSATVFIALEANRSEEMSGGESSRGGVEEEVELAAEAVVGEEAELAEAEANVEEVSRATLFSRASN